MNSRTSNSVDVAALDISADDWENSRNKSLPTLQHNAYSQTEAPSFCNIILCNILSTKLHPLHEDEMITKIFVIIHRHSSWMEVIYYCKCHSENQYIVFYKSIE